MRLKANFAPRLGFLGLALVGCSHGPNQTQRVSLRGVSCRYSKTIFTKAVSYDDPVDLAFDPPCIVADRGDQSNVPPKAGFDKAGKRARIAEGHMHDDVGRVPKLLAASKKQAVDVAHLASSSDRRWVSKRSPLAGRARRVSFAAADAFETLWLDDDV